MELGEYVLSHTERGECQCGSCIDTAYNANQPKPENHTIDMCFFTLAATNEPDAEEFKELTAAHQGEFCECNPLDGKEHSYLELGGWIGDQGLALQYMGLGAALGVFTLLTPKTVIKGIGDELAMQMAGMGFVTVQTKQTPAKINQPVEV